LKSEKLTCGFLTTCFKRTIFLECFQELSEYFMLFVWRVETRNDNKYPFRMK